MTPTPNPTAEQIEVFARAMFDENRPSWMNEDQHDAGWSDARKDYEALARAGFATLRVRGLLSEGAPSEVRCTCAYPDGHASYCPKRNAPADREKLIAEARLHFADGQTCINSDVAMSIIKRLVDALTASLDPEKVAGVLCEPGYRSPDGLPYCSECYWKATALCEAFKEGKLTWF